MKPTPLQRLDVSVRQSAPVTLTLLIAVLSVVPVALPSYHLLAPDFVLMAVFYWTVHRPDLMRSWTVFVIGLLDDVLSGMPLGVNALILVLVHGAILSQHRVFRGKSFGLVWWGFALIAPGAFLASAIVTYLAAGVLADSSILGLRLLLTVAAYPVMAWIMGRAQRAFLAGV